MKNASVILAVICLTAALACGEPEDVDDDVVLVDPATETVVTETTMTEIGTTDTGTIEELEIETPSEDAAVVDNVAPAPTSTRQPAPSQKPAPTRPAETTPSAPERTATPEPTPTPAPAPRPDPEPAPTAEPEPAPEPEPPAATSSKLPKTHTVDKGGVMHAPGSENATKRCVACHGKDLQGGRVGVSCFDCHDQQWE